ncbi:hypothetical protein FLAV_02369 [Flavobacteriales bacterium]|nr:hypothetical protein [Flavobacteriales bacterium]MCL4817160.1 hypothetical protein [Flavobacteriales bacterium]WKZ75369.1 MAG: hypothetical protein QY303_00450 [Vicingaceae bacterium]GIK70773.1 MAG: hypothetical protein BroJett020_20680 [Bacteroidota bacterium]CAG0992202.1 hypothetical protein FLAV_02369 [Flavobacteriales bacterium]
MLLLLVTFACNKREDEKKMQKIGSSIVNQNDLMRHPSIDDTIWVYMPYEADSVFGGWIAYNEDSNYIYFGHTDFSQYFLKYNKSTDRIETDLPDSDGSVKCRCEWCDISGTFSWVICYSVTTCSACCDKFCTAKKVLSGS